MNAKVLSFPGRLRCACCGDVWKVEAGGWRQGGQTGGWLRVWDGRVRWREGNRAQSPGGTGDPETSPPQPEQCPLCPRASAGLCLPPEVFRSHVPQWTVTSWERAQATEVKAKAAALSCGGAGTDAAASEEFGAPPLRDGKSDGSQHSGPRAGAERGTSEGPSWHSAPELRQERKLETGGRGGGGSPEWRRETWGRHRDPERGERDHRDWGTETRREGGRDLERGGQRPERERQRPGGRRAETSDMGQRSERRGHRPRRGDRDPERVTEIRVGNRDQRKGETETRERAGDPERGGQRPKETWDRIREREENWVPGDPT